MNRTDKISRKSFLQSFFSLIKETSQAIDQNPAFVLLPPGIESQEKFLQQCTECYDCVARCPHLSLRVCRDEQSIFFGKPIIDPQEQPCFLCHDLPCVTACKPGALQEHFAVRLNGVARIDGNRCLAFNGLFCRACVNACPLMDEAITINQFGHPVVNEASCTGCGICLNQCSLIPSAIHIKPRKEKG